MTSALIEPSDLATLLKEKPDSVRVLDASYALSGPNPRDLHAQERIGNAVFFDIDDIADKNHDLKHMLPTTDEFAASVSALGISNDHLVVVYDRTGLFMAASRAWWMFRVFGHDNVRVLNGGLPYWKAQGRDVTTTPPEPVQTGQFKATMRPELVKNIQDMGALMTDDNTTILDARSAERFSGQAEEPRPGLRSGHIPGSTSMPFMTLIDPATGTLKSTTELQKEFDDINMSKNTVVSCGSGVTACVTALALYELGHKDIPVYDGSWTEWGQEQSGMPVEAVAA